MCFTLWHEADGNWGAWTSWSSCSKTCATGTKTKTRACNNPTPSNGVKCPGNKTDSENCNENVPCAGNYDNGKPRY